MSFLLVGDDTSSVHVLTDMRSSSVIVEQTVLMMARQRERNCVTASVQVHKAQYSRTLSSHNIQVTVFARSLCRTCGCCCYKATQGSKDVEKFSVCGCLSYEKIISCDKQPQTVT